MYSSWNHFYYHREPFCEHRERVLLAATLSSVYGIYNGFELCDNRAVPGTEEYLDSEKYEYKVWDWDRTGNIKDFITRLNRIRRENPALHHYDNLRFYESMDDNILCYGKALEDHTNVLVIVVNMDPFHVHESLVTLDPEHTGISEEDEYRVRDLITGESYPWKGLTNYIRLNPQREPGHILLVEEGPIGPRSQPLAGNARPTPRRGCPGGSASL